MTEDKARTKWCPFARIESTGSTGKAGINRLDWSDEHRRIPGSSKCIASSCMAWRWRDGVTNDGYCGLAGEP